MIFLKNSAIMKRTFVLILVILQIFLLLNCKDEIIVTPDSNDISKLTLVGKILSSDNNNPIADLEINLLSNTYS